MEFKTITEITEDQIKEKGVQALADRPNLSAQYGASGFSAAELKLRFDKLASYLAAKINEIVKAFSGMEAAQYIRICLDDYGVQHLGELVAAFLNGDFAEKIVRVAPSVSAEERITLQAALDSLAQKISLVEEETKRYTDEKGETFATEIEASLKDDYELTLQLKNGKGEALNSTTVTFPSTKEYKESLDAIDKQVAANTAQISQNAGDIESLFAIARENNQFALLETEQAYTSRQTANGAEIFDGQYTAVTEIKGKTVRCENLFDKSKVNDNDFTKCTDTSVSEDRNVMIATGNEAEGEPEFAWARGWITPLSINLATAGIYGKVGDVITISADITLITQGSCAAAVKCYIYTEGGGAGSQTGGNAKNITTTKSRCSWSFTITVENRYYPIFPINSNRVRIENIKVSKDGSTDYQPYFTDLKHVYINSIKSTGRNLFDKNDKDIKDGWFNEDGVPNGSTTYGQKCSGWIAVEPNTQYVQRDFNTNNGVALYDKDKNYIRLAHEIFDGNVRLIETTADTHFIRVMFFSVYEDIEYVMKGNTAKVYEPYTEDIYELPETIELGEYDSFNPQTGEIIRQTYQHICTGDEKLINHFDTGYNCVTLKIPSKIDRSNAYILYAHNNVYAGKIGIGSEQDIQFNDIKNYFSSFDEFKTWLKTQYEDGTPVIVDVKVDSTITKIENAPKQYKVWKNGSETVIQGETDNSIYGAIPTIKNEYFTAVVGEEETNE